MRPGELAHFFSMGDQRWEWQSRPSRRRPAFGGVQSLQDGRGRRDSHHRQCSSCAGAPSATCPASSPEPARWRARSPLANISPSHCPHRSRNGPRETSALCAGRLGPADRDPAHGKMESRGISATLRQRWSCRPPHESVFGASLAHSPVSAWPPCPTLWFTCGHPCGFQHSTL